LWWKRDQIDGTMHPESFFQPEASRDAVDTLCNGAHAERAATGGPEGSGGDATGSEAARDGGGGASGLGVDIGHRAGMAPRRVAEPPLPQHVPIWVTAVVTDVMVGNLRHGFEVTVAPVDVDDLPSHIDIRA
jgi:hypothetical protein